MILIFDAAFGSLHVHETFFGRQHGLNRKGGFTNKLYVHVTNGNHDLFLHLLRCAGLSPILYDSRAAAT